MLEPRGVFDFDFLAWLRDFRGEIEDSVPHLDEVPILAAFAFVRDVAATLALHVLTHRRIGSIGTPCVRE